MAYRRRSVRKIRWKRRAGGARARRKKAFRTLRGRARIGGFYGRYTKPRGELKFHDLDIDDTTDMSSGTILDSVNHIPQGTTEVQRDGRKCTIKAIEWRYNINNQENDAGGTPNNGSTVRVILYKDKQCNGATAAVTDILETADYQSFYNLANEARFDILMDKTHTINYSGMASDGAAVVSQAKQVLNGEFALSCNIPLEFSSTTGAITELRSNNVGVLLITQDIFPDFSSKMRVRFVG